MSRDTEELLEIVELLDELGDFLIEAREDGVIDWRDVPKGFSLVLPAIKAFDNIDQIDDALVEMSHDEMQEFCIGLVSAIQKILRGV